jgi:hypothetical protein
MEVHASRVARQARQGNVRLDAGSIRKGGEIAPNSLSACRAVARPSKFAENDSR